MLGDLPFSPRRSRWACVGNRFGVGVGKCSDVVSGDFCAVEDDGFQCGNKIVWCGVPSVGGLFQHAL